MWLTFGISGAALALWWGTSVLGGIVMGKVIRMADDRDALRYARQEAARCSASSWCS